jgi:hypothetical protein
LLDLVCSKVADKNFAQFSRDCSGEFTGIYREGNFVI